MSNALSGGIIMFAIVMVTFTVFSISDSIFEVIDTGEKVRINHETLKNTQIKISNLTASIGDNLIIFNLENEGLTKLWDFQKFDLFVTYDASINGTITRITEKLNYTETGNAEVNSGGVVFDKNTSFSDVCSSCGFSHNVTASGEDRILVVGITPEKISALSSVTYDGQSLTKIRSDEYTGVVESSLWYLVNPSTGVNTVTATLSESGEIVANAISFLGVNQTDPIVQDTGTNGKSATTTLNVNTVHRGWIIDILSTLDGPVSAISGQIERWNLGFGATRSTGSTQLTPSPGNYPMTWTNSAGEKEFAMSAAALRSTSEICCPGIGNWDISIVNDVKEPGIINEDEVTDVRSRLSYIVMNGVVIIQIGTDNGVVSSSAITVS